MKKEKEKVYIVDKKPRMDGMAKFYLICIILFVLFVAYIVIYRDIHREEIINNVKSQSNSTNTENIIE